MASLMLTLALLSSQLAQELDLEAKLDNFDWNGLLEFLPGFFCEASQLSITPTEVDKCPI